MCKLWILFDQFISNIQEIVDIELMLDFIYMLFLFLSSFQMIGKEETNNINRRKY